MYIYHTYLSYYQERSTLRTSPAKTDYLVVREVKLGRIIKCY